MKTTIVSLIVLSCLQSMAGAINKDGNYQDGQGYGSTVENRSIIFERLSNLPANEIDKAASKYPNLKENREVYGLGDCELGEVKSTEVHLGKTVNQTVDRPFNLTRTLKGETTAQIEVCEKDSAGACIHYLAKHIEVSANIRTLVCDTSVVIPFMIKKTWTGKPYYDFDVPREENATVFNTIRAEQTKSTVSRYVSYGTSPTDVEKIISEMQQLALKNCQAKKLELAAAVTHSDQSKTACYRNVSDSEKPRDPSVTKKSDKQNLPDAGNLYSHPIK